MLVVMALTLMTAEVPMPSTGWDKSDHLLAFFVMTLLSGVAYRGRMALVLAKQVCRLRTVPSLSGVEAFTNASSNGDLKRSDERQMVLSVMP